MAEAKSNEEEIALYNKIFKGKLELDYVIY